MDGAAGNTGVPTKAELDSLTITGVSDDNLAAIQTAIQGTADDGTGVASLAALQALVNNAVVAAATALNAIVTAAENDSANGSTPAINDYITIGVTGVDISNLAAINSVLNTAIVNGAAVDTTAEVQTIVDSYQLILDAADSVDNDASKPSQADYSQIGIAGVDSPAEESLLGDVLDIKASTEVDSAPEVQALADAVQAVMDSAAGNTNTPSRAELESLTITGVSDDNLVAIQNAIQATADDGSGVASLADLQLIVTNSAAAAATALTVISNAAQADNATSASPALADYVAAGVSGVDGSNIDAISSALNSLVVNGAAVDSTAEVQAVVDSYALVLAGADGVDNNATKPSQADYARIGISGVDSASEQSLLGDVVDIKTDNDVDTAPELQAFADAVEAVMDAAVGSTALPSRAQLEILTITGVTDANLVAVQNAIQNTLDDGSQVDTLAGLQILVTNTITNASSALAAITTAAETNTANNTTPTLQNYIDVGVSGIDSSNLASINSVLNTVSVNGAAVDSAAEIQTLVDSYALVLAAADGVDDDDVKPTQLDYNNVGISNIDSVPEIDLLGDVLDIKSITDVDSVTELQALGDAVQSVMDGAAGNTGVPTKAELDSLTITGVSDDNLAAIQTAIQGTADDGSGVASLAALQALVSSAAAAVGTAFTAITTAAENDSANGSTPAINDYITIGVAGVDISNLAAINSVLNTAIVNGAAVDTTAEVQAIVGSYQLILDAADSVDNDASKPSQVDYSRVGITGVDSLAEESLLGDVLDIKASTEVDSAPEVQALADAVQAVMDSAAGNTNTPSRA